jgi:hypothetical protein
MKTLICVTICLFSLCQAFPAGEVSTLNQGPGNANNVQDECSVANWQSRIQSNKQQILNAVKAHVSTTHADRWYNISSSDRQCLTNAQQTIGYMWITGYFNTEDDCITYAKQKCPNAATEIDAWHNEMVAHRANASANWTATYNKLPQSVQNLLNNLNATFSSLRKSHALINQTAVKAAFLPIVEEFRAVSQDDWDKVVEVFPKTEVILGSDGNLTKPFFVLVEALENYLSNNAVDGTAVKQAKAAFAQYAQDKCRQYVPVLKNYVNNLPKPELSPEAHSGIESSVGSTIDAATGSASSATGNVPSS